MRDVPHPTATAAASEFLKNSRTSCPPRVFRSLLEDSAQKSDNGSRTSFQNNEGAALGASPIPKASPKSANAKAAKPKLGLRAWMNRVLEECDHAADGFDADAVHDLRVALRRCRSLADGLRAIDPDSSWKDMKKSGRKLFQALGELRDMQVMQEWIEKLSRGTLSDNKVSDAAAEDETSRVATGDEGDPVRARLLEHVRARETECKQHALKDLNQFDRKQWRQWSRSLPQRASRVRPGSTVYLHLALEKWTAAYDLHKHALRTRSQVALHQLRIGIKRFRYTVENFLPRQYAVWGNDLKELQDLLGDIHDLDVLWATAVEIQAFADAESRKCWREKLTAERAQRIARYREKMVGRESLWRVWRAELPAGPQLRAAAMSRLRTWAGYLDPDFSHSQRVAHIALLLYDGLNRASLLRPPGAVPNSDADPRAVLQSAALMHDVGKATREDGHHKASYKMIRELPAPLGWSARELELAAVAARYHRGALPRPSAKTMRTLPPPDRHLIMQAAGILRLADALDRCKPNRDGSARRLEVSMADGSMRDHTLDHTPAHTPVHTIAVRVAGYSALDRSAENIAAARHLLETVLRRPIVVRPLRVSVSASISSDRAQPRAPFLVTNRDAHRPRS
jgi:CHAD domain-containing protein